MPENQMLMVITYICTEFLTNNIHTQIAYPLETGCESLDI